MKADSIIMLGLACLTVGAMLGHFLTPEKEPVFVTTVEEVPVELVKEIVRTEIEYVPEPYEVEIIKEVPVELRHFKDKQELYDFLDWCRENVTVVSLNENCIDRALGLVRIARTKGYDVYFQTMSFRNGKIIKNHALASTVIGRSIYFIEPEGYKCWLVNRGG